MGLYNIKYNESQDPLSHRFQEAPRKGETVNVNKNKEEEKLVKIVSRHMSIDVNMNHDLGDTQESMESIESTALKGPMKRGRLKRLQEGVQKELGLFQGQGEPNDDLNLYTLFNVTTSIGSSNQRSPIITNAASIHPSMSFTQDFQVNNHKEGHATYEEAGGKARETWGGLESMRIDIQSVIAKVEVLSKGKGKTYSVSMHESEGSHNDDPSSPSSGSHRSHMSVRSEGHVRPRRERRHKEEHRRELRRAPWEVLKYKIPPFLGYRDVDQVLECFDYYEITKVGLITYEFGGYSLVWWNQYIREVSDGRRRHIDTWQDLRRKLRDRFVPTSYARDMCNCKECIKGPKACFMRANMQESHETTMARLLHGLKREVQDVVECKML
ncbi:hypothetical protein CR513_27423, partial [Mucuna pruriens]